MAMLSRTDTFGVDVPTIRPQGLAMGTLRLTDADGVEGLGEGTAIVGLSYGADSGNRDCVTAATRETGSCTTI